MDQIVESGAEAEPDSSLLKTAVHPIIDGLVREIDAKGTQKQNPRRHRVDLLHDVNVC